MPFPSQSRVSLAVLMLLGGIATSDALQLGETEAQITAKHGQPSVADHGRQLAMYYWAGWSVRLDYQEGKVARLIYKKTDYFTPADVAALLEANGGSQRWKEATPPGSKTRQWSRDDGAVATCDVTHAIVMTFHASQAAVVSLQQVGADPKAIPAAPDGPLPSKAPDFFPDPSQAKADPNLSEISAPLFPSKSPAAPAGQPLVNTAPPSVKPALPEKAVPAASSAPGETAAQPSATPAKSPAASGAVPAEISARHNPASAVPSEAQSAPAAQPVQPDGVEAPVAPPVEEMTLSRAIALGCMIFGVSGALVLLYKSLPKRGKPAPPPRKKLKNYPYGKGSGEAGLHTLRWDQFELLIAEVHRRVGFSVELSAALGAEDGVDLTMRRDNETVLVQCKHWKTLRLSETDMREFYGLMASSGAPKGIIVTLGAFTREAREFANGKGIDLIDRKTLEERMAAIAKPGENMCDVPGWIEEFAANARIFDPECPVCREPMALRQNRVDQSATWTCRNYPRCGGTREPRMDLVQLAAARRAQSASAVGG